MADLGCDYGNDPNSIMAYEAGRKDARAEGIAAGLQMAAAEAERRAATFDAHLPKTVLHHAREGVAGVVIARSEEGRAIAAWCEAKAGEVGR